jgi:hypothetical protein
MKKIVLTLLLVLPFLFNSCKKEPIPQPPQQIINLLVDEEPQALVDELELTLTLPEVTDINVEDASITDYPEFLDYDPFTVITTRTKSADSCVRNLEVLKSQKEQLNKAFLSKIECQKANKSTIARIHREIESWAKNQKENYYRNWYMVEKSKLEFDLIHDVITESQYKEKLTALEKTWKSKMNYLNAQVREKIKSNVQRAECAGKIKDCEKIYLESVMTILGREKYKRWISCYKHHYKKRK